MLTTFLPLHAKITFQRTAERNMNVISSCFVKSNVKEVRIDKKDEGRMSENMQEKLPTQKTIAVRGGEARKVKNSFSNNPKR